MKALLSVYDKTGIVEFARSLDKVGFELVSTGGTHETLVEEGGLRVKRVSDLTGFPEILDGRVKTLHPRVHAGILARRDLPGHSAQLAEHGIDTIDLVAVNLYPFVETVNRPGATLDDALENIDIGGPTMIRAAAKNFPDVIVVVDPADYEWVAEKLSTGREIERPAARLQREERRDLARKAFQHVALYDTAISRFLGLEGLPASGEITFGFRGVHGLRYGENPHQRASLLLDPLSSGGIARARQVQGKHLSYNNILDADAAWRVVSDFDQPAATVVKHSNPCGLAVHEDQVAAYRNAHEGDPVSAYGGVVGFNRAVSAPTAEAMRTLFYEVVVAPAYDAEALAILERRKNLRVLEVPAMDGASPAVDLKLISGGALIQSVDVIQEDPTSWRVVTERRPADSELDDLLFAWKAAKHVKSNAIVIASHRSVVGMGAGQPSRVASVHLALRTAGERARGGVLASDAFFPFADNIELLAKGGVVAVAQPGGSIRDDEVIAAANRLGIAMAFTGVRHFRH